MSALENVCIIDDDHIFIYGVKRLIQETSFCEDLLVYQNGLDALEELRKRVDEGQKLPAIIFLDLNMPMMTGWEFLDEYLKIEKDDPTNTMVYIISSSVDPKDLLKINQYPIVKNYILKPITSDDLENILSEMV